ncbi:hypothetical protein HDU98_007650 [Podochytrium sp. JEL0797]|nr:hypothetical protein HDU98_007650 [Podochytrium sp. JEL0797]
MHEVTVKARATFRHEVTASSPGLSLVWQFRTMRKNISFGLFFRKASSPPGTPRRSNTERQVKRSLSNSFLPTRNRTVSSAEPPSPTSNPAPIPKPAPTPDLADLTELLPITHYDSAKGLIRGEFAIVEPGVYILVFDNSFSVNTSKKLAYDVQIADPASVSLFASPSILGGLSPVISDDATGGASPKLVEGWILKKGNRKLQGYLKRWMVIDQDGNLSYFKEKGGAPRAVVSLQCAAIRLDHENLLIDIDSGSTILHMKAQTISDFQMWVSTLQSHAGLGSTSKLPPMTHRQVTRVGSGFSVDSSVNYGEVDGGVVRDAGVGIAELEELQKRVEESLLAVLEVSKSLSELDPTADPSALSTTLTKSILASQTAFSLYTQQTHTSTQHLTQLLSSSETAFASCLADNNRTRLLNGLSPVPESAFRGVRGVQMDVESMSMNSSRIEFFDAAEFESVGSEACDLEEEDEEDEVEVVWHKGGGESSGRESEGVVNIEEDDEDSEDMVTAKLAPIVTIALEPEESESTPVAAAVESLEVESAADSTPRNSQLHHDPGMSTKLDATTPPPYTLPIITRRKTLPAPPVSMETINIFSLLRTNVGKDLSTIAMPIALNEPLNLLQKLTEELEYATLLETAGRTTDPITRIILVAAFAVSGYASTVNRVARKPFNPLLGETYECDREADRGFRFVSEKVSHHPPVMACHARHKDGVYEFYQDNLVKSKFWGKSMELCPSGTVNVTLPLQKDHLQWSKVTTCMRNLFAGNRYLEHYGPLKVTSRTTGFSVSLQFKEAGYFSTAKNEVSGSVLDPQGREVACLTGTWDQQIYRHHPSNPNQLEVVWRADPQPLHQAQMYGFSSLAVELNEITPDLVGKLPVTDTRLRGDQRMYEDGRAEEAEVEKARLEQKQRETRKRREVAGEVWTPRWFEFVDGEWRFKGGYWESRGQFGEEEGIF